MTSARLRVLVTGSRGFIGSNLIEMLRRQDQVDTLEYDVETGSPVLFDALKKADLIFHLAGVNRPPDVEEFQKVNAGLTAEIVDRLRGIGRRPTIVFSSSTQAALDNPYGKSKKLAEESLEEFARETGAAVRIYRLPGVFGKWCRPNYNSVVATFCHNIARDLPVSISDPTKKIDLAYVDDVVGKFMGHVASEVSGSGATHGTIEPTYQISLGALAEKLRSFRESRQTLHVPDFSDRFTGCLFATYTSYLEPTDFAYSLTKKTDPRGSLAELLKSPQFGQIFVSRTNPGITRGDHFHNTKVEKFCVVEGDALIRFRHVVTNQVTSYRVRGEEFRVVDIPPGYTHSIENMGTTEMVVLFWSNEVFDPAAPDTFSMKVLDE